MKKISFIKVAALLTTALLLIFGYKFLTRNRWERFYKEKLYKPPRELLLKALKHTESSGLVLDLGAGAGNETADL